MRRAGLLILFLAVALSLAPSGAACASMPRGAARSCCAPVVTASLAECCAPGTGWVRPVAYNGRPLAKATTRPLVGEFVALHGSRAIQSRTGQDLAVRTFIHPQPPAVLRIRDSAFSLADGL